MIDPQTEIETLYRAEYGASLDIAMRSLGITVGGALLYLYTGWAASYLWGTIFALVHVIQFVFLKSRLVDPSARDVAIGGWLFVAVHLSFIWLPTRLAAQPDPALMLIGLLVLLIMTMYHLRRSDTLYWLVVAQAVIFSLSMLYVAGWHLTFATNSIIKMGICMVTAMAAIYMTITMLAAHRRQVDLVQASARLVQEQKMSAIGQLAGGIAHDFNNVLTIIKGNLELYDLLEDPDEKRLALADAYAAAERAEGVVEQLLVYARKSPTNRKRVDAGTVVRDVSALSKTLVPERIRYASEMPQDSLNIDLDERQLTAALLNLIKNAIDAIETNGTIQVVLEKVVANEALELPQGKRLRGGQYACFRVMDSGHGIPPKYLAKIHDPFFTTKEPGKGTGLGLSMVTGFVESMGGTMTIESSPKGTKVALYFPLVLRPAPEGVARKAA